MNINQRSEEVASKGLAASCGDGNGKQEAELRAITEPELSEVGS